jgi:hypothetical protein
MAVFGRNLEDEKVRKPEVRGRRSEVGNGEVEKMRS